MAVLQNVDTIVAIATPQGRGGVGIVRISGKGLDVLAREILGKLPKARVATYCKFKDGNGETLDQGIALYFPKPHSYTGEDVLELHGHGGAVILQLLLKRCIEIGARLAEPGEFTRRAYLNGKLDLAQAESVADLIEAHTAQAARSAMHSLEGEFSKTINRLVEQLIHLRLQVEAMLDFPEEQLDEVYSVNCNKLLNEILGQLQNTLDIAKQGSLLREGVRVVIAGRPNVGKSSLLNYLAGEELALVSDIPGTTRDVIRHAIQLQGVPVYLMDTAGLRTTHDEVENMGIAKTHQNIKKADLIILVLDASRGVTLQDESIMHELPPEIPRLMVFNKIDLMKNSGMAHDYSHANKVAVSVKTGEGINTLYEKILAIIGWNDYEGNVFVARERHIQALKTAQQFLLSALNSGDRVELFADDLSQAQRALNEITGEFTSDDLLGEIFSRFCIGK